MQSIDTRPCMLSFGGRCEGQKIFCTQRSFVNRDRGLSQDVKRGFLGNLYGRLLGDPRFRAQWLGHLVMEI